MAPTLMLALTLTGLRTMFGPALSPVQESLSFVGLRPRVRLPSLTTQRLTESDSAAAILALNNVNLYFNMNYNMLITQSA